MQIVISIISAALFFWLGRNARQVGISIQNMPISQGGRGGDGGHASVGGDGVAVGGGGGGGGGSAPAIQIGIPDVKKVKMFEWISFAGAVIQLVTAIVQLKTLM